MNFLRKMKRKAQKENTNNIYNDMSKEDELDMEYFLNEFDMSGETVKFKCLKCKAEEEIPKNIVDMLDREDPGDKLYAPRFDCQQCDGLMEPIYYVGHTGIVYEYSNN